MARDQATQAQILDSVVARLRERLDVPSESVFVSDEPMPLKAPPSTIFVTVSAMDGQFPDGFFAGGGTETLMEQTGLVVTTFIRCEADAVNHGEVYILSHEKGLVRRYKPDILRALLIGWEPTYKSNELLRDMLQPTSCVAPREWEQRGAKYMYAAINFSTSFDWDLGE